MGIVRAALRSLGTLSSAALGLALLPLYLLVVGLAAAVLILVPSFLLLTLLELL